MGLVDAFRDKHPGVVAYTYYSFRNNMREKGRGWRLDYVLVSGSLKDKCVDAFILKDFKGSDHVPAGVTVCLE